MEGRTYPGYPEYILLDLVPPDEVRYKRGATEAYLVHEEFERWHQFFCSPQYQPPEGKDILVLHTCTWAKPYDFSAIGTAIRGVTDPCTRAHRVILSNAGVVPYEYQMNPTFCAYDWKEREEQLADREYVTRLRGSYQSVLRARLERYLQAHRGHYRRVVHLGLPVRGTMTEVVHELCREVAIPCATVPTLATYRACRNARAQLRDLGDFFMLPAVLEQLTVVLELAVAHE